MNRHSFFVFLLLITHQNRIQASVTSISGNKTFSYDHSRELKRRQQTAAFISTCGFRDGDANQPRTANPGFDCRVDTQHALWGFCPTTVIVATDCGLAGNCVDSHSCSNGCGITGTPGITTFTCTSPGADFCSTAILTAGPDQTYSYLACAKAAETVHLLVEASTTSSTSSLTTSPSSSQATASLVSPTATSTSSTSSSPSTSPPSHLLSSSQPVTPASASTTSSTTSIATPNTSNSGSNNVSAIVGGVIGGLALLAFVIFAIMFLHCYRRENRAIVLEHNAVAFNSNSTPWRNDQETQNFEASKYPYWKRLSPIELSTQKATSPFELSS